MQLFKLILALPAIGLLSLALLMQSAGVLVMAVNSTSTSHHHHHKRSCGGYSDNYTEFVRKLSLYREESLGVLMNLNRPPTLYL